MKDAEPKEKLQILILAGSPELEADLRRWAGPDLAIEGADTALEAVEKIRDDTWDAVLLGDRARGEFLGELLGALPDARGAGKRRPGAPPTPSPGLDGPSLIVGESPAICQVRHLVCLVRDFNSTVLITGETGTGKELVARAVHYSSKRAAGPFLCINCAAIPNDLLEDELFGHLKGAFTGAVQSRKGYFEQANRGTLFLDEIGNMSPGIQQKLLRVLQDRQITPLGATRSVEVDVRIVAATNADLGKLIQDGRFREDLFYRLNVFPIHIPPLRDRAADIHLLVEHFVNDITAQEGIPHKGVSAACLAWLSEQAWPGNIRELRNAVEYALIMSGRDNTIEARHFNLPGASPPVESPQTPPTREQPPLPVVGEDGVDFSAVVQQVERQLLLGGLKKTGGNKQKAAQLLRMKRTTLVEKMKRLNLETEDE